VSIRADQDQPTATADQLTKFAGGIFKVTAANLDARHRQLLKVEPLQLIYSPIRFNTDQGRLIRQ
jgi:hypothetical protein